jgi:hypothetical protein
LNCGVTGAVLSTTTSEGMVVQEASEGKDDTMSMTVFHLLDE